MKKIFIILIVPLLFISCKPQSEFQILFNEAQYAESFFSSLDLKTVSSNSFNTDELTRYTLTSHLPKDNEELKKIRITNGMQVDNLVPSTKNNILQCNLKMTVNSKPDTNDCDNIEKLLSTATD